MSGDANQLQNLVSLPLWTPLSAFPPTRPLGDRVFALGNGLFVLVNPVHGGGDRAYGVGWAESDYWATRAFDGPQFRGKLDDPPPPQWKPPPSLAFLGRPTVLSFKTISDHERGLTGPSNVILVTAHYRMTDGAFLSVSVNGANGIKYTYASNDPRPADQPVALEVGLREAKHRWFDRVLGR